MTHPLGERAYEYGIDAPIKLARTITVESEKAADETFAVAQGMHHPLPTGYIVKAVVRCNQLDTFRMVACDYATTIERPREGIQRAARRALWDHFRHAHPYLGTNGMQALLSVVSFNFRDIGR